MKSDFTLAVLCLVLLTDVPSRMATSDFLADKANVHPVRIRRILSTLRNNGYIESKEGQGGGFFLTCDPGQVSLDEIYQLTVMGTLKPKCPECSDECYIAANIETVLDDIFNEAEQRVTAFLRQYTLSEILDRIKREYT